MRSLLLASLLALWAPVDEESSTVESAVDSARPSPEVCIDRGPGGLSLCVPRGEKLVYGVFVDLGVTRVRAGEVTLETGVEPYRESLLMMTPDTSEGRETAWLRSTAVGEYGMFQMDAVIETRHLPSAWPRVSMLREHKGAERKRRELLIGFLEGKEQSRYRRDTENGAPKGTRIWKEPRLRDVPEHALDMLSAVYLARSLVRENLSVTRFPLVDKYYLWQMKLTRGEHAIQKTPAGTFDAIEVKLKPGPHPDEDEAVRSKQEDKFRGLFGLQGTIQLWTEEKTGVPIRVQGDLPVGFLDLSIDVILESYEGTPAAFRPHAD